MNMKLTVAERNTLLELAHLLNEGLGDIAVMLAEPWLQDAPGMTTLVRRRAGLRALCNATRGLKPTSRLPSISGRNPTKTHIAHIAAPTPCRPKLAPVTRCVPQEISGRRRDRKTSSASGTAEPFTPVSNSNREC